MLRLSPIILSGWLESLTILGLTDKYTRLLVSWFWLKNMIFNQTWNVYCQSGWLRPWWIMHLDTLFLPVKQEAMKIRPFPQSQSLDATDSRRFFFLMLVLPLDFFQPARQEVCNLQSCVDLSSSDSNEKPSRMSGWSIAFLVLIGLLAIGGVGFAGYVYYKR